LSDDKTTQETVREMAKLALASNRISDIQEKNLKIYPFVFFNGVLSAKIDYDFTNNQNVETEIDKENLDIKYKFQKLDTRHFHVAYRLSIDEKVENDQLEKRFEMLDKSIKALFWKETKVSVYFNDILKYESSNV